MGPCRQKRRRRRIDNSPLPQAPKRLHMAPSKGKGKQTDFKISWSDSIDDGRISRMWDWLEQHPTERHMLFSDSTKDAKQQGRRLDVGKAPKITYHRAIATYVFSNDKNPMYRNALPTHLNKFAKSVSDRLNKWVNRFYCVWITLICVIIASRRSIVFRLDDWRKQGPG